MHGTGEALPVFVKAQTDSPSYRNRCILFVKARVSVSDLTRDPSHCQMIILELPRPHSVVVSPQRRLPVGCAGQRKAGTNLRVPFAGGIFPAW